jgi:hypothetical protein
VSLLAGKIDSHCSPKANDIVQEKAWHSVSRCVCYQQVIVFLKVTVYDSTDDPLICLVAPANGARLEQQ